MLVKVTVIAEVASLKFKSRVHRATDRMRSHCDSDTDSEAPAGQ